MPKKARKRSAPSSRRVEAKTSKPPARALRAKRARAGVRAARQNTASIDLAALRGEIEAIDAAIVKLVSARQEVALRVGRVKARAGLPIRDFHTEKEVRARAARLAGRVGVDPGLIEAVVSSLIEGAVRAQEEIQETSYAGARHHILIVGGRGKMGAWLAHFFHGQGHAVTTYDPAGELERFPAAATLEEGLAHADVAILATPLERARETLADTLALRPRALIADIFSLKSSVASLIREGVAAGHRIASIHPLFGPDARVLAGRTMLVCDTGDRASARRVRAFFEPTSLTIRDVSLETHDRVMAIVLGLSHAVNLIFSRALVRTVLDFATLHELASATFQKQIRTASEVASENPALYHAIQHENRESAAMLALLAETARQFTEAALDPDRTAFVEEMRRARAWYEARPAAKRRKATKRA
jgi:chorismate mutase/prephenate dehydrogenase